MEAIIPPDTIAAIATAAGRGGVGVVRVSGGMTASLLWAIIGKMPVARSATLATFRDAGGGAIDHGIALYFPGPNSYTGEDVCELQGHGGPVVMRRLLQRCLELGCRMANPGEFTQRAYLNEKLDLAQAESVADLIDASSAEAARSAARSLTGEFSTKVGELRSALVELRAHVEACIDFPEEEIDPADRLVQAQKLADLRAQLVRLMGAAKQGAVLRDGLTVVLIGRPNVGKSSLLNNLAGEDVAIVSPIPGTTRDHVRATILLEGVPIHLIDTAGLRDTQEEVERIGIERTWAAISRAGAALLIAETGEMIGLQEAEILAKLPPSLPIVWVYNKIDIHAQHASRIGVGRDTRILASALTGEGIDLIREWLLETAGWQPSGEGVFMARTRHLVALKDAAAHLDMAATAAAQLDIFAEELRLAQRALSLVTGEFTPDDLLGEIFSKFCIGK